MLFDYKFCAVLYVLTLERGVNQNLPKVQTFVHRDFNVCELQRPLHLLGDGVFRINFFALLLALPTPAADRETVSQRGLQRDAHLFLEFGLFDGPSEQRSVRPSGFGSGGSYRGNNERFLFARPKK